MIATGGEPRGKRDKSMRQPLVIRRGRYELLLPLGEGRVTRVYLAVPVGSTQTLVVKRLRPELAHQPDLCANFLTAARIGLQLNHPQIAKTTEVFTEGDEQLFAMEYLEGQTLADLVKRVGRKHMPLEEHLYVLCQALNGLAYCHSLVGPDGKPAGGNHREASANNIFITYTGEVKLIDFGVPESLAPGLAARQEARGIGPFSPEQLCGLPVDAQSDVFSIGVLLWEALARRARAQGDDRAALIAARVAGSEPGPESLPPGLPRELIDICARATELDAGGRFANPAELAAALERIRATFPRVARAGDLAALISRNFQLDRDAMRRRINQHLEDARSAVRLKTPPVVTPAAEGPSSDREITVPGGRTAAWFMESGEQPGLGHNENVGASVSDELPALPAQPNARRVGMVLMGIAAAAVIIGIWSLVRPGDAPSGDTAASGRSGPAWEPIAPREPVAVDRAPALPTLTPPAPAVQPPGPPSPPPPAETPAATTAGPPAATPATQPASTLARVTTPPRPRPKRAASPSPLAPAAEPTRQNPVPLIDSSGSLVSVPRPALLTPRSTTFEESGRGTSSAPRRQLDEQDPYK
jgi:serine/threonine protein kinase